MIQTFAARNANDVKGVRMVAEVYAHFLCLCDSDVALHVIPWGSLESAIHTFEFVGQFKLKLR